MKRFLCVALLCASGCDLVSPTARSSALVVPSIVIAVVHPGGGNTGAIYDRDFVVLVNRADVPLSTGGLTLQYASGSGTVSLGATDATLTELPDRVLSPGQAMLVSGAFGAGAGTSLPPADVDDATPLAMATSSGRIALVRGVSPLGCNGGSIACDAIALDRILDRVAWGSATFAETTPASAPSNAQALVRADSGCADSDDNAADFVRAAPVVRASADPPSPCADPADGGRTERDASVDAAPSPDAGAASGEGGHPSTLQGAGYLSPFTGTIVSDLRGVVTYVESRRFAIEAAGAPLDANGVFVRTPGAPPVVIGSLVAVEGVVREERSGCGSCAGGDEVLLSTTTIDASGIVQLGRAELPPAARIDASFPERYALDRADRDVADPLRPESDALDRLERLEARRVELVDTVVVGPTRSRADGRRTLAVLPSIGRDRRSSAGLLPNAPDGTFGDAFVLVDSPSAPFPMLHVGDVIDGPVVGVVDTDQGRPIVRVVSFRGARHREPSIAPRPTPAEDSWTIASFNAHGLSAVDDAARFSAFARTIVDSLASPELLVLEEISDDSGAADDGVVSARETLSRLEDAIVAASGPRYRSVWIDPVDGADGGAPGANIRTVLLVRDDRGLLVRPASSDPFESAPNPSRLGDGHAAFVDGRKPLVVELDVRGESVVLVCVHLRSHLGDTPRLGRIEPPRRPNDSRRLDQVLAIAELVDRLRRRTPERAVIVAGDFNDAPDAAALAPLVERDVLPASLDRPDDSATFLYDGLATSFDRVHLSTGLASRVRSAQVVHLSAIRADGLSDHDPIVVEIGPSASARRTSGCSIVARAVHPPVGLRSTAILAAILLGLRRRRRCP